MAKKGVTAEHKSYEKNKDRWKRCRDVFDGSDAVKDAGTEYLPMLDSHHNDSSKYEAYKLRAMFFNGMGRTVEGLAGFIFQKEAIVDVSSIVEKHLNDVTMTGVDAQTFALSAARELLITARYGILVDLLSEEEQKEIDPNEPPRPYWVGYKAEDIISWRTERRGTDPAVLTRVVLREWEEEQDSEEEFQVNEVEQYRVLELDDQGYSQTVWRKEEKGDNYFIFKPKVYPERRGEMLNRIPFEFLSPTDRTVDVAKPPLLDMVEVNLSHYRTSADLEHGRHFTALPTPWVSGARETDEALFMGSGYAWDLEQGGMAGMLEFSGAGLASLVTAEESKRKQMAILGARMLEEQPVADETATAFIGRTSGEGATLRTMTSVLERGITNILRWHQWWIGGSSKVADEKVSFELNRDFMYVRLDAATLQVQLALLQSESISYETFYYNIRTGGWARPGVSAEKEREQILKEGGGVRADENPPVSESEMNDPDPEPEGDPDGPEPETDPESDEE